MPVAAVTPGGTVRVKRASRMAMSGIRSSSLSGILTSLALSVTTEYDVTSDPVPLVVGMATSRGLGRPSPALWAKNMMALAASMADPPPRAMTASARSRRKSVAPLVTVSRDGSGSTPSKIPYAIPPRSSWLLIRSTKPVLTMNGSVTMKARLTGRRSRVSMPSPP